MHVRDVAVHGRTDPVQAVDQSTGHGAHRYVRPSVRSYVMEHAGTVSLSERPRLARRQAPAQRKQLVDGLNAGQAGSSAVRSLTDQGQFLPRPRRDEISIRFSVFVGQFCPAARDQYIISACI